MIGKINTGGLNIHGIIEQYKVAAGENVKAGDFVKFINNHGSNLIEQILLKPSSTIFKFLSSFLLDKNTVCIFASRGSSTYVIVCNINGEDFTYTSTTLNDILATNLYAVKLSDGRVVLLYNHYQENLLYAALITIEDNSIQIQTNQKLSDTLHAWPISACLIEDDKIFVTTTTTNGTANLTGLVCSVNTDNSISVGISTLLDSSTIVAEGIACLYLSNKEVLIAYAKYNSELSLEATLYAMICTIENNSITINYNENLIQESFSGYGITLTKLDNNRVFISHTKSNAQTGIVCIINNKKIDKIGIDTKLHDFESTSQKVNLVSASTLARNQILLVYLAHSSSSSYDYYEIEINIDGLEISIHSNQRMLTYGKDANQVGAKTVETIFIERNKIFIAYVAGITGSDSSYNQIRGRIFLGQRYFPICAAHAISNNIFGVAKTSGKDGQSIKVITANCKESEVI